MVFSSITFLYYFLPAVLIMYFIVPAGMRNLLILVSSFVFYGYGEGKYALLMAVQIIAGYIFSIFIEKNRNEKKRKFLAIASVIFSLSFLLYFKYADFFIESFSYVTGISFSALNLVLPAGISFYTFQVISYTIDIYKGKGTVGRFTDFAAYVSMFPQLIAGPIVRYSHIQNQLRNRKISCEDIAEGIRRFVIGLGKKVLIANQLAEINQIADGMGSHSLIMCVFNILCYGLYVYFDFSGYSDMAIGIGRIMGFHFRENFNYPFISESITEFWQRWHISLGSWFRDYVYIPMGGNKKGKRRQLLNISIVWMLTGLWHGAGWNYVLWGIYFGAILIAEKTLIMNSLKKHKVFSHFYVLILVSISFIIFKGDFNFNVDCLVNEESLYYIKSYILIFFISVIGATPLLKNIALKINEKTRNILEIIIVIFILVVSTAYLVDGSFNPFLYFRF